MRNASALVVYTQYINGYNVAVDTLHACWLKNKKFVAFAEEQAAGMPVMSILPSLLIQPIQRIPRYM